jgi:hypothetical protein
MFKFRPRRVSQHAFSFARIFALLALLGPGLVSAIAGDDAGGITTYAIVGAKYGYNLIWTIVRRFLTGGSATAESVFWNMISEK